MLRVRPRAVAADAARADRHRVALQGHDRHGPARIGSAGAAAAGGRIAPRPAAAAAAAPGFHRDAGDPRRGHERRGTGIHHGRGGQRRGQIGEPAIDEAGHGIFHALAGQGPGQDFAAGFADGSFQGGILYSDQHVAFFGWLGTRSLYKEREAEASLLVMSW